MTTVKKAVSIDEALASEASELAGGNFSAFVAEAVEHHVRRIKLDQLVDAYEAEHGAPDTAEQAAVAAELAALDAEIAADRQQTAPTAAEQAIAGLADLGFGEQEITSILSAAPGQAAAGSLPKITTVAFHATADDLEERAKEAFGKVKIVAADLLTDRREVDVDLLAVPCVARRAEREVAELVRRTLAAAAAAKAAQPPLLTDEEGVLVPSESGAPTQAREAESAPRARLARRKQPPSGDA